MATLFFYLLPAIIPDLLVPRIADSPFMKFIVTIVLVQLNPSHVNTSIIGTKLRPSVTQLSIRLESL